ncbi:MAG: 23S rRNA (pseudouridine(1915)-N(3))-methyltransferase RlmH [Oscillospiraceae bacterium]|nr:23S rRNA (pseudouridine(1915)-N(3))-methyltransferase RlmH [Oscillospiraceae bacterium]
MFAVTVLAVGRLKEPHYIAACREYQKRLSAFCGLEIVELPEHRLPDKPSPAEIAAGLAREAAAIRTRIPRGAWVCVLTPEGELKSSEQLAGALQDVKLAGKSAACFILGSSFGLDDSIKRMADLRLSMSPMTFPHHLARVMLLEQLYRAESIQTGSRYHK